MANYGASEPYFALIDTENTSGLPTYKEGVKLANLISCSDNPTFTKATLYADNAKAEEVEEFISADIDVSLDDVSIETKSLIFGAAVNEDQELEYKGNDTSPYGGYGFFACKLRNNVRRYLCILYPKVKATLGGVSHSTKGETITFAPDSVRFSAAETEAHTWKVEKEFPTEAEARAWIKEKLNITA